MAVSDRERVAHVLRRLSMGAQPDLLEEVDDVDEAIAAGLDLSTAPAEPVEVRVPEDREDAMEIEEIIEPLSWWLEQMATSPRLIEERLVWFWHDHFATSLAKVRSPYLMWKQHQTVREHATGNFADLLRAIARDPAMLFYLDGTFNHADGVNENFAREVMELHTLGRGNYSQDDIVEAARSFTGWVINAPGRRFSSDDVPPWAARFVPFRHDDGEKTLLGVTGEHDMDDALDILLDQPETARRTVGKLYTELVGLEADDATTDRLADAFDDYDVLPLVEAIVAEPAFTSDDAVRTKIRTPVEKVAGLFQAVPTNDLASEVALRALRGIGYVPMAPPNPAGFPKGAPLLGPHQLVHTLDLAAVVADDAPDLAGTDLFARFGCFDVSDESLAVVDGESDPQSRAALVLGSPEYAVV